MVKKIQQTNFRLTKVFRGQEYSGDKSFQHFVKIWHFCPPNFCPIRYIAIWALKSFVGREILNISGGVLSFQKFYKGLYIV